MEKFNVIDPDSPMGWTAAKLLSIVESINPEDRAQFEGVFAAAYLEFEGVEVDEQMFARDPDGRYSDPMVNLCSHIWVNAKVNMVANMLVQGMLAHGVGSGVKH